MRRAALRLPRHTVFSTPLTSTPSLTNRLATRKPVPVRTLASRPFSTSNTWLELTKQSTELGNKGLDEDNDQLDYAIGEAKELQARTPWHREGTDRPPVKRPRSAGAMTKGIPD